MSRYHDAYKHGISNNVSFVTSTGASNASSAFGSQTYWIRVAVQGAISATSGVRINVGDGTPTAASTSPLLPVNWVEYIAVSPGQKIAVLGNDTVTGTLSVVELT